MELSGSGFTPARLPGIAPISVGRLPDRNHQMRNSELAQTRLPAQPSFAQEPFAYDPVAYDPLYDPVVYEAVVYEPLLVDPFAGDCVIAVAGASSTPAGVPNFAFAPSVLDVCPHANPEPANNTANACVNELRMFGIPRGCRRTGIIGIRGTCPKSLRPRSCGKARKFARRRGKADGIRRLENPTAH